MTRLLLAGLQILSGLHKPGLHLLDALLEACLCRINDRRPGVQLLLASTVKCLKLLEVAAHGLGELVLLGPASAGAWRINNLEPGGGDDLFVKDLPLGRRSGACRPRW